MLQWLTGSTSFPNWALLFFLVYYGTKLLSQTVNIIRQTQEARLFRKTWGSLK